MSRFYVIYTEENVVHNADCTGSVPYSSLYSIIKNNKKLQMVVNSYLKPTTKISVLRVCMVEEVQMVWLWYLIFLLIVCHLILFSEIIFIFLKNAGKI